MDLFVRTVRQAPKSRQFGLQVLAELQGVAWNLSHAPEIGLRADSHAIENVQNFNGEPIVGSVKYLYDKGQSGNGSSAKLHFLMT